MLSPEFVPELISWKESGSGCGAKNRFEFSQPTDFVANVAKKRSLWMGLLTAIL